MGFRINNQVGAKSELLRLTDLPPWVKEALEYLEQNEVINGMPNRRIQRIFNIAVRRSESDQRIDITKNIYAWCGAFVTFCLTQSGCSRVAGTGSGALPYRWYGRGITDQENLPIGCIAVKERTIIVEGRRKKLGHVGFVIGKMGNKIFILGGNQNDEVNISSYNKTVFKSFRMPPQTESFDSFTIQEHNWDFSNIERSES